MDKKEISIKANKDRKARICAFINWIILILALNLPLYYEMCYGNVSAQSRANKIEGFFVILLLIIMIALIYIRKQKYILSLAIIFLGLVGHYFFYLKSLDFFESYGIGFYLYLVAAIGTIISVCMIPKDKANIDKDIKKGEGNGQIESNVAKDNNEEKNINKPLCKKDSIWIIILSLLTIGTVIFLDYDIFGAKPKDNSQGYVQPYEPIEEIEYETDEEYAYKGSDGCLTIENFYIVEDREDVLGVVQISFKNKCEVMQSFNSLFVAEVVQSGQILEPVYGKQSPVFSFQSANISLASEQTINVYLLYKMKNDKDFVEITIKRINTLEHVLDKRLALNEDYYKTIYGGEYSDNEDEEAVEEQQEEIIPIIEDENTNSANSNSGNNVVNQNNQTSNSNTNKNTNNNTSNNSNNNSNSSNNSNNSNNNNNSSVEATKTPGSTVTTTTSPATKAPTAAPTIAPTPEPTEDPDIITIYYKTSWNAYFHYSIDGNEWTEVPGKHMSNSEYEEYKVIKVDINGGNSITGCFNNGEGSWDNNNGGNYYFAGSKVYTLSEGVVSSGAPK